ANSVGAWRRRWAAGDFALEDEAGRGRKATFSPPRSGRRQGHRLRGGGAERAAPEPPVARRPDHPRPLRPGPTDRPEYRLADPRRRRDQALAGRARDLRPRPPLRREGPSRP